MSHIDKEHAGRRRHPRDQVFLRANMVAVDGKVATFTRVRNISSSGLMAENGPQWEIGQPVEVDLRGIGPFTARVIWADGDRFGLEFKELVDPKLARVPTGSGAATVLFQPQPAGRRPGLKLR
jgi:hypothetical protein